MSPTLEEFVSQTAEHQVRQRWAVITLTHTPPPLSAHHVYLRGGECSVRTRLVSIPPSSPSLLRTCVTEEENRGTEVRVRRGKGRKSKRKKETVEHNDTLQLQNVFGEEVNKKGEEQRINRQREKETKEKERDCKE